MHAGKWRDYGQCDIAVADLWGFLGFMEPPSFGLDLVLRSTDDKLSGTSRVLATELRKLLLWLTLVFFSGKFDEKRLIGLIGEISSFKNNHKWNLHFFG